MHIQERYLSYQVTFVLNFLLCYSAMKLMSLFLTKDKKIFGKFLKVPYLSVRSMTYHPLRDESVVARFIFFLFLTAFSVAMADEFLVPMNFFDTLLFSPAIYFFTEMIGAFGQLLFFTTRTFSIHRTPLQARSLSHFWGKDWNLWVQDWLRDVSEGLSHRKHSRRIILVFLISGIFHELMVNLPYWLLYGESYFGTMLGYFLIQAVALWIDKRFVKKLGWTLRRIYLWACVILPSPLFINVPLLKFFGLIDA